MGSTWPRAAGHGCGRATSHPTWCWSVPHCARCRRWRRSDHFMAIGNLISDM
ncbi:hypothetical protein RAA17_17805 [Komagataeibacter rhaeticus]|nr:hypothetical protein [Komagataeibacter rhaeticus]